ncbi:MAG TPA: hypothetical protein VFB73_17685 [Chloroflexota bacterium]|nr:hypothetical protein [Chloroflexota bacterium]
MRRAFCLSMALGLLLTAVGAPAVWAQEAPGPAPGQPAGPAAERGPAPGGPQRAVARLSDPRNPLIRGEVVLEQNLPNATAVTVTVYGLEPGSTHLSHIHRGSCTGPILFPLRDLVADHTGVARAVSTVPAPINLTDWWINVHAGYALPSPGITCGKVEAPPPPVALAPMGPPIIPEADSLALVAGGLLLLGGVAGWRARARSRRS